MQSLVSHRVLVVSGYDVFAQRIRRRSPSPTALACSLGSPRTLLKGRGRRNARPTDLVRPLRLDRKGVSTAGPAVLTRLQVSPRIPPNPDYGRAGRSTPPPLLNPYSIFHHNLNNFKNKPATRSTATEHRTRRSPDGPPREFRRRSGSRVARADDPARSRWSRKLGRAGWVPGSSETPRRGNSDDGRFKNPALRSTRLGLRHADRLRE